MRALTLLFSFSSSRLLLQASFLQSMYTLEVNNTFFPSGSHLKRSAPVESCVNFFASPPSIESRYTCELPSREEMNPIVFPSGDQAGALSCPLCVIWIGSPPAVLTIQMLLTPRFASISGVDTAYTTHFPSAETSGAETRCILMRSSNVIACFAGACACADTDRTSTNIAIHPLLAHFVAVIVLSPIPAETRAATALAYQNNR